MALYPSFLMRGSTLSAARSENNPVAQQAWISCKCTRNTAASALPCTACAATTGQGQQDKCYGADELCSSWQFVLIVKGIAPILPLTLEVRVRGHFFLLAAHAHMCFTTVPKFSLPASMHSPLKCVYEATFSSSLLMPTCAS